MISLKLILLTSRNCIIDVCLVKRCDACIVNPEIAISNKINWDPHVLKFEEQIGHKCVVFTFILGSR